MNLKISNKFTKYWSKSYLNIASFFQVRHMWIFAEKIFKNWQKLLLKLALLLLISRFDWEDEMMDRKVSLNAFVMFSRFAKRGDKSSINLGLNS